MVIGRWRVHLYLGRFQRGEPPNSAAAPDRVPFAGPAPAAPRFSATLRVALREPEGTRPGERQTVRQAESRLPCLIDTQDEIATSVRLGAVRLGAAIAIWLTR